MPSMRKEFEQFCEIYDEGDLMAQQLLVALQIGEVERAR